MVIRFDHSSERTEGASQPNQGSNPWRFAVPSRVTRFSMESGVESDPSDPINGDHVKKKLRLLLFEDCNRACDGCCNKQWDLNELEAETSFDQYNLIILTGGEVMLDKELLIQAISDIKRQTDAPIYVYTANVDDSEHIKILLRVVNGITLTLHEQEDIASFEVLNRVLSDKEKNKSLRLNVFKGISLNGIDTSGWNIKQDIEWIEDCPLPENEVFKRYESN